MAKKAQKKVNLVAVILLSICLAAYTLMYLSERFHLDGIPTLSQFRDFLDGKSTSLADIPENTDCSVHFIDVGQGDCSLILSDGAAILIDAGENDKGGIVLDYLKKLGITKLDLVIGTHPHSDHIGGLDTVIEGVSVEKVLLPRIPDEIVPTTKTYTDLLTAVADNGLKVTAAKPGDSYTFGAGELTILGPNRAYDDLNNMSVVCRFDYGTNSFLFTGDMETTAESDVLEQWGDELPADVLKVGHHGSTTSTGKAFYRAVSPEYCVILVGDGNDYGHPHAKTLKTLSSNEAEIYRTDFQGSIVFSVIEDGLRISTEK